MRRQRRVGKGCQDFADMGKRAFRRAHLVRWAKPGRGGTADLARCIKLNFGAAFGDPMQTTQTIEEDA